MTTEVRDPYTREYREESPMNQENKMEEATRAAEARMAPVRRGRPGLASGGGHAVHQQHEEQHQAEQNEEPQPLPVPGQVTGVEVEEVLHQVEQPAAGDHHHQGQVDGDQEQHGEEHAGNNLEDAGVGLAS